MAYTLRNKTSKLSKAAWLHSLKFGILSGISMSILFLLLNFTEFQAYVTTSYPVIIVLLAIMIWAGISYRKKTEDLFPIRQAYLMCVCIGLVASLIYSLSLLIYIQQNQLTYIPKYIDYQSNLLIKTALEDNLNLREQLSWISQATAFSIASKTFFDLLLISAFLPLFLALLLKKENNPSKLKK